MRKILVFGMTENPGGVESFLMNYYRNMDRNKIRFDFLCNSYDRIAYEDELVEMGSRTFHFTARSRNPWKYYRELNDFFKKHGEEYCAIWVNVCSLANIDYLKMARKYGIRRRIIHSHNSQNMDGKFRGMLHLKNRKIITRYATDFWACSEDAAKWFFDSDLMSETEIIHNAIDVEQMAFDADKRASIRKRIGWEDRFVVGNIGRLHFQKNQTFILKIFSEMVKKLPESGLVLVGQGEDEKKLRIQAKELGIEDKVCFAGVQHDISGWLSSFDFFLFPSVFEGLSIAALEAQANGVSVLASKNVISAEVCVNSNFEFLALEKSVSDWADKIISMQKNCRRENEKKIKRNFETCGYDVKKEAERLEKLLLRG